MRYRKSLSERKTFHFLCVSFTSVSFEISISFSIPVRVPGGMSLECNGTTTRLPSACAITRWLPFCRTRKNPSTCKARINFAGVITGSLGIYLLLLCHYRFKRLKTFVSRYTLPPCLQAFYIYRNSFPNMLFRFCNSLSKRMTTRQRGNVRMKVFSIWFDNNSIGVGECFHNMIIAHIEEKRQQLCANRFVALFC